MAELKTQEQLAAAETEKRLKPASGAAGTVETVIHPCAGDVIERTHGVLTLLADLAAGSSQIGQNDGREIMDFAKWLDDQINTFVAGLIAKKRRDLTALEKALGNPPATTTKRSEGNEG